MTSVETLLMSALDLEQDAQARLLAIPESAESLAEKVKWMLDIPRRQAAALERIAGHPEAPAIRAMVVEAAHKRWTVAHRYRNLANAEAARWVIGRNDLHKDEVTSSAIEGLYRTAVRWRPNVATYVTYARWWVRAALFRDFPESRGLRLPGHLSERIRYARILADRGMSDDLICERLDLSPEMLTAGRVAAVPSVSLDEPMGEDSDASLHAVVASQDPRVDDLYESAERVSALRDALEQMPERHRRILYLRFGLGTDEPMRLADVGKVIGVGRETCRKLERTALRCLRDLMNGIQLPEEPKPKSWADRMAEVLDAYEPIMQAPKPRPEPRISRLVRLISAEPGITQTEAAVRLGMVREAVYSVVAGNPDKIRKLKVGGGHTRLYPVDVPVPEGARELPGSRARVRLRAVLEGVIGHRMPLDQAAAEVGVSIEHIRDMVRHCKDFRWDKGRGSRHGMIRLARAA